MASNQLKIKQLKEYFKNREDVMMAFVFGSQIKERHSKISDWDIACYFKPISEAIEWEKERDYPEESKIWGDLTRILQTDNVDFIVLNRVPSNIADSAIRGLPLVIKDRRLYLEFMLIITREAEDYHQTAREYSEVYWRSSSLNETDKDILNKRLIFLDSELKDAHKFHELTQYEYERDNSKRRDVERWIENLMNAAIDISKTILASEKKPIPSSYREILQGISLLSDFPKDSGEQLANWIELRNILAHEYLDIRWKRIKDFIQRNEPYFKKFIEIAKMRLLK